MNNYFKFNLALMISLTSFLITDVIGSSALNPYAEPYFCQRDGRDIAMVTANINGSIVCVQKDTLLKLGDASRSEIQLYTRHVLGIYFRVAVYNSYHKVAYTIAEVLFARILPKELKPFPNLSNFSEAHISFVLSKFYLLLTKIPDDQLSPADRHCFERHVAKLKLQ